MHNSWWSWLCFFFPYKVLAIFMLQYWRFMGQVLLNIGLHWTETYCRYDVKMWCNSSQCKSTLLYMFTLWPCCCDHGACTVSLLKPSWHFLWWIHFALSHKTKYTFVHKTLWPCCDHGACSSMLWLSHQGVIRDFNWAFILVLGTVPAGTCSRNMFSVHTISCSLNGF